MVAGDYSRVIADAEAQVAAGAQMLDVNAGIPLADEPALLAKAIQLVQSITDVPLAIDSSIVAALEAGLAVYKGKALLNSVTGEEERLEVVLPLVKKYGCAVVAISNDETGISQDPDVRFEVAKKIVNRAADYGIPACDIVVDPLVMPIGAINQAGVQVMQLLHRLKTELKVNTTCGASNVSFGLPERNGINSAFLTMAIGAGLTSAITNPLHEEVVKACMAADVMMGHDPDCARWIRKFREAPPPPADGSAARGRREGGLRRRPSGT
jgi:5-methyltetrahydrofolate--homocysteine methyltransferase